MKNPLRLIAPCLALLLVMSGCDNPFAPKRSGPTKLEFGSVYEGDLDGEGTRDFRLQAQAGQRFIVYLEADDDSLALRIADEDNRPVAVVRHPGGGSAEWHPPVEVTADGEYRIEVTSPAGSRGGSFSLSPVLIEGMPESAAAVVQVQDTVDERIDHPNDHDEFTVDLQAGQEVRLFVQKLTAADGTLLVTVWRLPATGEPAQGDLVVATYVTRPSQELETEGTENFTIAATGKFRILVQSAGGVPPYTGAYRLLLRAVNRAPELATTLVPGDTLVGEAIDHVGDIDEFTLRGTPGAQYNLFTEASGTSLHPVRATVFAGGTPVRHSEATVAQGHLLNNPAGVFTMPAAGEMMVRVEGPASRGGLYHGAYRLLVHAIDFAPETPAPVLPSKVPFQGAIEQYGDVDEYPFVLGAMQQVGLLLHHGGTPASRLQAALVDAAGATREPGVLPAGSYRVRVLASGGGTRDTYRGTYEAVLAVADPAPEHAPPELALGDTVRIEGSDWPADVDRFLLRSTTADTLRLYLRRDAADSGWTRTATVIDMATGELVLSDAQAWPGPQLRAARIDVPPGATYAISIDALATRWMPGTTSSYVLAVERASSAPERAQSSQTVGDTVGEAVDFLGDIDEFTIRGTPGRRFTVWEDFPVRRFESVLHLLVTDSATGEPLTEVSDGSDSRYASPATFPASGTVRVRMCAYDFHEQQQCVVPPVCPPSPWSHTCPDGADPVTSYRFAVQHIEPLPERRPAAFTIGDTVSGEILEHPYDIDEFTFQGTAGDRVVLQLQWLTDLFTAYENTDQSSIFAGFVDAATGKGLVGVLAGSIDPALDTYSSIAITLPSTGSYIIRVTTGYDRDHGAYRFRVLRAPEP